MPMIRITREEAKLLNLPPGELAIECTKEEKELVENIESPFFKIHKELLTVKKSLQS